MANDVDELFRDPEAHQKKYNPDYNPNYNKGYNKYNNNRQYNNNYNKNYNNKQYYSNRNNYTNSSPSYSKPKYNNQTNNLYLKKDFKPLHHKPEKLNKPSKHVLLDYFVPTVNYGPLETDKAEALTTGFNNVLTIALDYGLSIRLSASSVDQVFGKLLKKLDFENKDEIYAAWEKMSNVTPKTLSNPTLEAYSILRHYNPGMVNLPDSLRAILASKVNAILGKDTLTPPKAIVLYLSNKLEEIPKGEIDFKQFGSLYIYYQIAKDYDIPIFNLASEGSVERFRSYLNTINNKSKPKEDPEENLPF